MVLIEINWKIEQFWYKKIFSADVPICFFFNCFDSWILFNLLYFPSSSYLVNKVHKIFRKSPIWESAKIQLRLKNHIFLLLSFGFPRIRFCKNAIIQPTAALKANHEWKLFKSRSRFFGEFSILATVKGNQKFNLLRQ